MNSPRREALADPAKKLDHRRSSEGSSKWPRTAILKLILVHHKLGQGSRRRSKDTHMVALVVIVVSHGRLFIRLRHIVRPRLFLLLRRIGILFRFLLRTLWVRLRRRRRRVRLLLVLGLLRVRLLLVLRLLRGRPLLVLRLHRVGLLLILGLRVRLLLLLGLLRVTLLLVLRLLRVGLLLVLGLRVRLLLVLGLRRVR